MIDAWRALGREQHTAAVVALGLFVTMLLPWYSKTVVVRTRGGGAGTQSLNAFQAFSFVEAAVLLVSAGVLAMLFARGEGRDFQLPGGDGLIVSIAGGWAAILIFYRLFDKPGLQGNQQIVSTVGVQWGIFLALLVALGLLYAGRRMHASERGAAPPARARGEGPRRRDADEQPRAPSSEDVAGAAKDRLAPAGVEELTTARRAVPAPRVAPEAPRGAGAEAPAEPFAQPRSSRRTRPRYPPPPGRGAPSAEQLSLEQEPPHEDQE
jgi:hypothetical protein